jgi:alcohol dehydrogenase
MKALVYETFRGPIHLQHVPEPIPTADGVVVRVKANGLCRSDWHGWIGHDPDIRLPHVPGHELSGVVEEVGPEVRRWRPGDRVTVPFALGCGRCPQCVSGNQQICDNYFQPGFTAWGSLAEWVALPYADTNLVRLPDELDDVSAASLGCRFVTAFRAVVAQGRIAPGEWLAVHGCGGVGLAAIMIGRACGAQVIGVDTKKGALEQAQALGAAEIVHSAGLADVPHAIQAATGGGAHVSLDALGSRETCRNSILCLRKRGRHVQVGLMLGDERDASLPMATVIARELELYGSHGMQAHAYGPMLDMIRSGKLQPGLLVQRTIALEDATAHLEGMGAFTATGVTVVRIG